MTGIYRADNHGWLFAWKSGSVFQAGPSSAMNWYGTTGSGSQSPAGKRGGDADSMCGDAIMYDAVGGKILTVGGAPDYQSMSPPLSTPLDLLSSMYNEKENADMSSIVQTPKPPPPRISSQLAAPIQRPPSPLSLQ